MDRIKALIVDDKKITGDLFGFMLGSDHHDIKIVQSGQEALDIVKKERFDVAFIDIIMPQKDGISTLKEMKLISPSLPVVMMSGYTVEEKREEVMSLGALTCLDKPVAKDEVRKVVREAIGKEI